jgi:hypothetical protein
VLKRFKDAFRCNIAGVTTSDLQAYIDRLKLGLRSKNNHRQTLHSVVYLSDKPSRFLASRNSTIRLEKLMSGL